jgi:hypothetical protein
MNRNAPTTSGLAVTAGYRVGPSHFARSTLLGIAAGIAVTFRPSVGSAASPSVGTREGRPLICAQSSAIEVAGF